MIINYEATTQQIIVIRNETWMKLTQKKYIIVAFIQSVHMYSMTVIVIITIRRLKQTPFVICTYHTLFAFSGMGYDHDDHTFANTIALHITLIH